jgi:hypothetical protein
MKLKKRAFDAEVFLQSVGTSRRVEAFRKKQTIFAQDTSESFAGDPGGDDRHDTVTREYVHDQVQETRLDRIQRQHKNQQVSFDSCPS